jgi:two-component system, response regulator PdtaR
VPDSAAKTILVVEDDVLIRLSIADDLMAAGFVVVQAASADEALKILHKPIDLNLVMTDIRMPGSLDGLALAGRVRTAWPELKIVVLSGDLPAAPPLDVADAFLHKPYDPSAILAVLKQLLGA